MRSCPPFEVCVGDGVVSSFFICSRSSPRYLPSPPVFFLDLAFEYFVLNGLYPPESIFLYKLPSYKIIFPFLHHIFPECLKIKRSAKPPRIILPQDWRLLQLGRSPPESNWHLHLPPSPIRLHPGYPQFKNCPSPTLKRFKKGSDIYGLFRHAFDFGRGFFLPDHFPFYQIEDVDIYMNQTHRRF